MLYFSICVGDECEMGVIGNVNFDEFGERVYFLMIGLREMLDFCR